MPDFSDYPSDLQPILSDFSEAVDMLMRDFQAGKISLEEWRNKFANLLALYIGASYLVGSEHDDIIGDASIWITAWLAMQLDFLNGFRDSIAANFAAGGQYSGAWGSRAQMYVGSVIAPFWYGGTEGLPLPAYPGDFSAPCGVLDACGWIIKWINRKDGDADCYWKLNQRREVAPDRHCQTCVERSKQWNPIKVRNWKLVLPASVESQGPLEEKESEKHLPGQHDQSTHGIRSAANEKPKFGPDGRPQNLAATESYNRMDESLVGAREMMEINTTGLAERLGISEKEASVLINAAESDFRKICREGEIRTRVRIDTLENILEDGRVMTQFETGTSEGHFEPDARAEAERNGLGTPMDIDPENRPVYGYVYHSDAPHDVSSYGSVSLCLDPSAKSRTSVTFGDSLNMFYNERMFGAPMMRADKLAMTSHLTYSLLLAIRNYGVRGKPPSRTWLEMEPYIEAQIHGQVRISDIQKVIFGPNTSRSYAQSITSRLDALGILWEFSEDNQY